MTKLRYQKNCLEQINPSDLQQPTTRNARRFETNNNKTKQEQRKHTCNECNVPFDTEALLRIHKGRPHAYPCDECDLKFTKTHILEHHIG